VRNVDAPRAKIWHERVMLDRFDISLLNIVQRNDSQTADQLAQQVALSPSAIARRLRRLRSQGWISRTIALLAPRLTKQRLRAFVTVQLSEHADQQGKSGLIERVRRTPQVSLGYELAGVHDLILMFDCADMAEFNATAESVLVADPTVRRYETYFVKQELKFEPFVQLDAAGRS
jgi:DNA-binding Lrp family transcriptional regulator